MNVRKITEMRFLVSVGLSALPLLFGCNSETCTPYSCANDNPANSETLNICERNGGDDDEAYTHLDDSQGNEIYECYCDASYMQEVARRICTEGVVCRPSGSHCDSSGDCCAGLHCTYNVCG